MTKRNKIIGKVFKNNIGLEFKVIEKMYIKNTSAYYKILFLISNTYKVVEYRNILKGSIRDNYHKNICGIACKGNINTGESLFYKIAFKRWYAMIERCYKETSINYKSYGRKEYEVAEEWLCFETFIKDIQLLAGYDYSKYISGGIQLDKDFVVNNNTYSKETCCFISRKENARFQPTKSKPFFGIDPNGNKFYFKFQSECARQFNLTARTIGKILNGQLKSHKGWTFYYK